MNTILVAFLLSRAAFAGPIECSAEETQERLIRALDAQKDYAGNLLSTVKGREVNLYVEPVSECTSKVRVKVIPKGTFNEANTLNQIGEYVAAKVRGAVASCDAATCEAQVAAADAMREEGGTPTDFREACRIAGGTASEHHLSSKQLGLGTHTIHIGPAYVQKCADERGELTGPYIVQDEPDSGSLGAVRAVLYFKHGAFDGAFQVYNEDGSPHLFGRYKRNSHTEPVREFDTQGRPLRLTESRYGEAVSCTGDCEAGGYRSLPKVELSAEEQAQWADFLEGAEEARMRAEARLAQAVAEREAMQRAREAEDRARLERSRAASTYSAVEIAQKYVRKQYAVSRFSPLNETYVTLRTDGWFVVQGWLEGPNGYGVVIRKRYSVQVAPTGSGETWTRRWSPSIMDW